MLAPRCCALDKLLAAVTASAVRIDPAIRGRLIDWLDEGAADARDDRLYPEPQLAQALQALADALRRQPAALPRGEAPCDTPRSA